MNERGEIVLQCLFKNIYQKMKCFFFFFVKFITCLFCSLTIFTPFMEMMVQ